MADYIAYGGSTTEELKEEPPEELNREQLDNGTFHHPDGGTLTFAEELARQIAAGAKTGMFATTEF